MATFKVYELMFRTIPQEANVMRACARSGAYSATVQQDLNNPAVNLNLRVNKYTGKSRQNRLLGKEKDL